MGDSKFNIFPKKKSVPTVIDTAKYQAALEANNDIQFQIYKLDMERLVQQDPTWREADIPALGASLRVAEANVAEFEKKIVLPNKLTWQMIIIYSFARESCRCSKKC